MCGTVSASSRANHAARVAMRRFRAPRGARLVTGSHYPGRGAPRADLRASRTKPATARCCEKRRALVVGETLSKAKTTPAAFTSSACCSAGSAAPVSRGESRS